MKRILFNEVMTAEIRANSSLLELSVKSLTSNLVDH